MRTSQFTVNHNCPHSFLTVLALSYRPVEKVLSGVLTPSTARTWSKPWRSSTSLPHLPSAHHPPPHPGKLSADTKYLHCSIIAVRLFTELCIYWSTFLTNFNFILEAFFFFFFTLHVFCLPSAVPPHPLAIYFYKAAHSKVRTKQTSRCCWSLDMHNKSNYL